jgi:hypothetical protein
MVYHQHRQVRHLIILLRQGPREEEVMVDGTVDHRHRHTHLTFMGRRVGVTSTHRRHLSAIHLVLEVVVLVLVLVKHLLIVCVDIIAVDVAVALPTAAATLPIRHLIDPVLHL